MQDASVNKVSRKTRIGYVVSDKMQKTVVVRVDSQVRHSVIGKTMRTSKRYKAHDENNEAKVGDKVLIEETRPLSKDKRWRVKQILEKAAIL